MSASASSLFESAVPYYARFRTGYPPDRVAALSAAVGVGSRHRVVDIGCGTGQLTIPLARHAGHVVALDPVEAMLDAGRRTATAAGVDNVSWLQGDAAQLADLVEPGAQLATFAASFHWTDRERVLDVLAELLLPGGAVAVLNDVLDEADDPAWVQAIGEVRSRYPGLTPAPGAVNRQPRTHREVLEASAFSAVDSSCWEWTRQLTVEQAVGLQLSYSFSTPALLGDRVTAFTDDVRAAILSLHPDGVVSEPFRVEVLIARRPSARRTTSSP